MGGVFAKITSLETKFPSPLDVGNISSLDWYFSQTPLTNMIYLYIITPHIRMLDSDWLIAVIFILQIQALHCEFAEFLIHVGVFA